MASPATAAPQLAVLLVEDDSDTADIYLKMLARLHIPVNHAISMAKAKECLMSVHTYDYDAILLDLHLPDSRGVDTVKVMRSYTDLPIVVLSDSDEELEEPVTEAGAQDWLSKTGTTGPQIVRALRLAIARDKISMARTINQFRITSSGSTITLK